MAFDLNAILKFSTQGVQGNLAKASKEFSKLRSNMNKAKMQAGNVGRGMRNVSILGTGMAAGVGVAVNSYMQFQKQMDSVAAKMKPTKKEYADMADLAKSLGAQTIFTGKQAAEGFEYLALAGFKAKDAMGVLPSVLYTAGAGALELGKASDIITDSMSAMLPVMKKYGDKQQQAVALSDMLALAQARTNTNIEQLGEAISYGGGAMANMGIPLQEIIGSMGALADASVKGSSGGTSLLNMMNKLAKPSSKATKLMSDMGISMDMIKERGEDGKMKLKSMADIVDVFSKAIAKNPDVLDKAGTATEIFGMRGQRAFFALQNKGVAELRKLYGELGNSKGAAKKMYEDMTDNIYGAWESMKSATSGITLNLGEMFSKMFDLKGVIVAVTEPLGKFSIALQNAMRPTEEWSDSAKKLMQTPIGQFALGVAEGFKEVKKTILDLIKDGKKLFGFVSDGETDFKSLGKTITKLAVGLALIGPPMLAIGVGLLFLSPIVTGVTSLFGLMGRTMLMVKNVSVILWNWLGIGGKVLKNLTVLTKLYDFWIKTLTLSKRAFVHVGGKIIKFFRLDVLWTKTATTAKTAYNLATKLMGSGLKWLAGKIMATTVAQKASVLWTKASAVATAIFSSSLWACPVTWIVGGIIAIGAAIYLLIKHWNKVTEAVMYSWKWLGNWKIAIAVLMGPIGWMIGAGVVLYKNWGKVVDVFKQVWIWMKKIATGGIEKVQKVLSWFGIGGDKTEKPEGASKKGEGANVLQFPKNTNKLTNENISVSDGSPAKVYDITERTNRSAIGAQKAMAQPTVNVSPTPVNVSGGETKTDVYVTLDGDEIASQISKKERKKLAQSGDLTKASSLYSEDQASWGGR